MKNQFCIIMVEILCRNSSLMSFKLGISSNKVTFKLLKHICDTFAFHHIGTKTLILKIVLRYFDVMPHSATAEEMMGPGQKYDNNAMGDSGSLRRDFWNRFGDC